MIVARPIAAHEPDLLAGHEHEQLRFVEVIDGTPLLTISPPAGGWTHDALERAEPGELSGWDAYLGSRWVGSSEL